MMRFALTSLAHSTKSRLTSFNWNFEIPVSPASLNHRHTIRSFSCTWRCTRITDLCKLFSDDVCDHQQQRDSYMITASQKCIRACANCLSWTEYKYTSLLLCIMVHYWANEHVHRILWERNDTRTHLRWSALVSENNSDANRLMHAARSA